MNCRILLGVLLRSRHWRTLLAGRVREVPIRSQCRGRERKSLPSHTLLCTLNNVGVAQSTPISRKKNKVNIACGTTYSFSPYSLSLPVRRPPASINYTPACPSARLPAQSQPFSATKKTEQNECDCIIFVTLCSSNCLYTKKSNKYQKNRLQLCRNIRWV